MKIGFTTRNVEVRAWELREEYGNRIFYPCIICEVNQCYEVEQQTHKLLKSKELWREMFDVTADQAEKAFRKAVEDLDGAIILNIESRDFPSDIFSQSTDMDTYQLGMLDIIESLGVNVDNVRQRYEEIPF